jgi:hypothetical protein
MELTPHAETDKNYNSTKGQDRKHGYHPHLEMAKKSTNERTIIQTVAV